MSEFDGSLQSTHVTHGALTKLTDALTRYFDLMHTCNVDAFATVFLPTVTLHGFRDGQLVAWSAEVYKDILRKRESPQSRGASRADEILLIDFASTTQAFTKVRVKISELLFVDYLTWHFVDGEWLISSKGFHLEASDRLLR